jgi:mRNA-degrading endonuclease RelE of RelBE toxin-antitoxin system
MAFTVRFTPPAREHLKGFRKRDQRIVVGAIERQLVDRPEQPARNRKKLEENPLAPWELRVGNYRVFYDVNQEDGVVVILAVGRKERNILRIGDEEVEL